MKLNNPKLKVHFEIESKKSSKDMVLSFDPYIHRDIPCASIVLDNPSTQVFKNLSTFQLKSLFFLTFNFYFR